MADDTTEVTGGYEVSSDDYDEDAETATLSSLGISWVTELRILTRRPAAWIVATLTAFSIEDAYRRMNDGESPAELIVEEYLYQQILLPAATSIWDAGLAVLGSVLTVFLGSDHALGVRKGSQIGIADLPYTVYQPLIGSVDAVSTAFVDAVTQINQGMAAELAFMGLAGPAIVTFFWLLELGGLLWLLWVVVNLLDPGIVVPTTKAVLRPVRNVLEWLYD